MTVHSIQTRDNNICKRFVKDYEFLSFAKNIGKNIGKNISQKCLVHAKSASKRAIRNTAEASADFIINKIAVQINKV